MQALDPSSSTPASPLRATVLIVDDNAIDLEILRNLFQPHHVVLTALSGELALQLAAGEPKPDLILLDVLMPDMDGYAVLTRLQDNPATRDSGRDKLHQKSGLRDFSGVDEKTAALILRCGGWNDGSAVLQQILGAAGSGLILQDRNVYCHRCCI